MSQAKPRCGPGSVRDHGAGLGLADPWLRSPSSLAIHNIGSVEGRQHAVEEAARVLPRVVVLWLSTSCMPRTTPSGSQALA
jgi:hypothetical protein